MTYALSFSYPRSGYTKFHPARLESDFLSFRYFLRYFYSSEIDPFTKATETISSIGTSNGA